VNFLRIVKKEINAAILMERGLYIFFVSIHAGVLKVVGSEICRNRLI
jgi:hypothetical protein